MAQWTFNALGECTFIYIVLVYQAEIGYLHSVGVNLQWTDVATFDYRGGGSIALTCLAPWKLGISTGSIHLHGFDSEKDLTNLLIKKIKHNF